MTEFEKELQRRGVKMLRVEEVPIKERYGDLLIREIQRSMADGSNLAGELPDDLEFVCFLTEIGFATKETGQIRDIWAFSWDNEKYDGDRTLSQFAQYLFQNLNNYLPKKPIN